MMLDRIMEYADYIDKNDLESVDSKTREGIESLYNGNSEEAWNSYCRWLAVFYRKLGLKCVARMKKVR